MISIHRGAVTALVLAAVLAFGAQQSPARAAAQTSTLAADESKLADGMTMAVRKATLSPTAALEVWVTAPSDGYGATKPGLARLTALSLIGSKVNGTSLRDEVRADGGQLMVSVFPTSTEITVLASANAADRLADVLLTHALHPTIDAAGFREGKARLAEQQAVAGSSADVLLRDGIFSQLFTSGPFHASTYGVPDTLRPLTIDDVQAYATQAFVPANLIVVAVGGSLDEAALRARISAAAPPAVAPSPFPASPRGNAQGQPVNAGFADTGGVSMGWAGPPVSDETMSTAMDFLSDYLTRPDYGVVANAVRDGDPGADFNGQFITLRDAGVFYMTVVDGKLSGDAAVALMRKAMAGVLAGPLPQAEFARALQAFRVHTLLDTQTPEQLADNYGWYFAQGAPAYAPSVTDLGLTGDYYVHAGALTPDTVYAAAKTYLAPSPVTATVVPRPSSPATTSMLDCGLCSARPQVGSAP